MRLNLISGLACLSLVAGCATLDGPPVANGERTKTGAVIGGLIGGLVATNSGNRSLGKTAAGAIAGGILGGAIGQALDKQARDLEQRLDGTGATIVNTGSELVVTMPEAILFALNSAELRPNLRRNVQSLAANLQDYPSTTVDIIGHTDSTGEAAYNQQLSARRASVVEEVLFENGVAPNRLRSFGRGENEPVATNLTDDGRALNRRVEIIIRPIT